MQNKGMTTGNYGLGLNNQSSSVCLQYRVTERQIENKSRWSDLGESLDYAGLWKLKATQSEEMFNHSPSPGNFDARVSTLAVQKEKSDGTIKV